MDDKTYFYNLMKEICNRSFATPVLQLPDEKVIHNPPILLFGDFMRFGAAKEDRIYEEIKDVDKLKAVLQVTGLFLTRLPHRRFWNLDIAIVMSRVTSRLSKRQYSKTDDVANQPRNHPSIDASQECPKNNISRLIVPFD